VQQQLFNFNTQTKQQVPAVVSHTTPSGFVERPYQQDARIAVQSAFETVDSTIIEMATGLGKTEIFTQLMNQWEHGRCLVIAPQITLVSQAAKKIQKRTGILPGIEQAHNWSDETPWGRSKFVVASKDTLSRGRYERIRDVGLVVVDECHLSITRTWQKMLSHFLADGAKVLGVTATAKRHDKRSMQNLYQGCAFQYGIRHGVDDGWLVPAETSCIQLESLDLSRVSTVGTTMGRDFNLKELNTLLERYDTIYEIADVTAKETRGLKTAIYCSSVEEARMVSERLSDSYGIHSAWICSDTSRLPVEERHAALKSFTEDPNGVTHLCNVGILTTGWDFPELQAIVMARPTKSRALYTQIFGRGTRPLEGVVDFAGSCAESRKQSIKDSKKPRFKMIDLVDGALSHKIMTSPNVMEGHFDIDVIERAKEILDDDSNDLDEALAEAGRQVREEQMQRERDEQARIRAEAQYRKLAVDPFSRSMFDPVPQKKRRGARFPFGRYKGTLIRETPDWYLLGCMNDKPKVTTPWLKQAIRKELTRRNHDF